MIKNLRNFLKIIFRSDKFPLTLHKTGQYCKKIKGKIYYFGTDKKAAFQKYLEQIPSLHLNLRPPNASDTDISVKNLCNQYLDYQESRASSGEIKLRQFYDQTRLLRAFVIHCGPNTLLSKISTIDLQSYRKKLVNDAKAPNTVNNYISAIKAMFNWALDNEVLISIPNLKAIKKITSRKSEKNIFSDGNNETFNCCQSKP